MESERRASVMEARALFIRENGNQFREIDPKRPHVGNHNIGKELDE